MDFLVVLGLMTAVTLVVAVVRDNEPARVRTAGWLAAAEGCGLVGASALFRSAGATVRVAAATALDRVGATVDDVLALRQAEAAHAWDGAFLREARQSIASIQSRLVGADHGQVAVAPAAGELSLGVP